MPRLLLSFSLGLLFGVGLHVSGMTSPGKVLGFLDVLGPWDPSLAFVMGGAVAVGLVAFQLARRRGRTLLDEDLRLPSVTAIDAPLVGGSLIFGVGWGLSGVCPGPGIVDLGFFDANALVFVVAMAAGMTIEQLVARAAAAARPAVAQDA